MRRHFAATVLGAFLFSSLAGPATALAADPLVPNGNFEQLAPNGVDPASWIKLRWGKNSAVFELADVGTGHGGRVTVSNYVDGDVKWKFVPINVRPGVKYSYAESYSASVPSWIVAQYVMNDGSVKYGTLARPQARSNFGPIQPIVFLPPVDSRTMNVFHLLNSNGTLTIDDVSLTEIAPPPENPVPNGNLETRSSNPAVPQSWRYGSFGNNERSYAYPVPGPDSPSAAEVTISKYVSGDAKWYYAFVSVTPGEEYRLTQKYRSNAPTLIGAQFMRADGSSTYEVVGRLTSSGGAWRTARAAILVPAGTVAMTTFQSLGSVGTLAIDDVTLERIPSGAFSEGMVSFAFDDNLPSQRDEAVPRLNAAGLRASFLVNPSRIGNTGSLTAAELEAFADAGHEIGGHTRTHAHLYGLSSSALNAEIGGGKSDVDALGLLPNVSFAYPFGEYDEVIKGFVQSAGYAGARASDVGYNTRNSDRFALKGQHVESNVPLDTMKGWVDAAVAAKTWLILEMHEVKVNGSRYSITPDNFQALIDYIGDRGIRNVTLEEGVRLMDGT